ncbi:protein kintoun [Ctenodactylus gundi]
MTKAAGSAPLEDLDLSRDEVQRLTSAFQDPEFRRLFSEYAEELRDPENRRRYEAEVTALERERGVDVRFVHPEPGYVLRTSLDGAQRCYVNVCSNPLVGTPGSRPGPAPGAQWSLPYSLAPGRPYAGRGGTRYTVYDVVFHPDTLALARRHQRFRHMLDAVALEAVEKQFHVTLDRRNAKTLKIKYKGAPEAAVLRTPLPGGIPAQPAGDLAGLLPGFPYPYPAAARPREAPRAPAPSAPAPVQPAAPTEPRCSVVQRHHVDLQDYRCSRDSAPSPVPHELVVTIELPLLRSAEQAALEVTEKLLCLDSRKPDYRLRLSLPYPVDDSRGKAQFNKARRQLVVTLPVASSAARRAPASAPEVLPAAPGSDETAGASPLRGDPGPDLRPAGADDATVASSGSPAWPALPACAGEDLVLEPEERDVGARPGSPPCNEEDPLLGSGRSPGDGGGASPCVSSRDPDWESPVGRRGVCGDLRVETSTDPGDTDGSPSGRSMGPPGTGSREALCPPLQCKQDEESVTLLIQVPRIQPRSLRGDVNSLGYTLRFCTQDFACYSLVLQFAPENKLSAQEPAINVSSHNAVIVLAKSPESRGHWQEWYCGLNSGSLEEMLFVSEENVNEFLEVLSTPLNQTRAPTPPLIEVLQVTNENIQIHAELQEYKNPDQLQGKEGRAKNGCPVTKKEKENLEHLTTCTTECDSSVAVEAPEIDTCVSVSGFEQEPLDVSQKLSGKSQPPEVKEEPEFRKQKSVTDSNEEKENLKKPVVPEEKELDGDHLHSVLNDTEVHRAPEWDSIKEVNAQDGSVQMTSDHVTQCAFSFQNSLLYDLD